MRIMRKSVLILTSGPPTSLIGIIAIVLSLALPGCSPPPEANQEEPIAVYFNDPLAGLPHLDRLAEQAGDLLDHLLRAISSARRTIDAAVYSITSEEVIAALGEACARGVRLRILTEEENYRGQLEGLPSHCLELELDQNDRLMHAKFMIADRELVWTGSANWTDTSFYYDANNAIVLRDRELARSYELEFEQMFQEGRFGPSKVDNNPEEFDLAGTQVEVYFAPSDRPRGALLRLLAEAQETIELAMFYYTDECLFQALAAALTRGVQVRAVWDFRGWANLQVSKIDELMGLGVGLVDANPGLVHHKYAIIDREIVITGSANWTRSGMDRNDEDLIVVHSPKVARLFAEEFERLYRDALRYDEDPLIPPRVTLKHYNTQDVLARIEWRPHLGEKPDYYELCRARSPFGPCERLWRVPPNWWFFVDEEAQPGRTYWWRLRSSFRGKISSWSNQYVSTAGLPECPATGADEECDCDDGRDNDGDGHLDCRDYDCAVASKCTSPEWPSPPELELLPGVLSAEEVERDLARYLGGLVTVRFYVVSTYDSGRAIFLDSSRDYERDFTVVIFKEDEANFAAMGIDPVLDYDRKLIEVTGILRERGGPEIVVCSPQQIKLLE